MPDAASLSPVDEADRRAPNPVSEIDRALRRSLDTLTLPPNLRDAMEYALLGPGKRLRPILVFACCEAVGGPRSAATPSAAAVEMIHAFSLVHDDLPALDDDDLRRGRPTAHVKYGEAMAVLAGDGLMSAAFVLLASAHDNTDLAASLVRELASATTDMIGGQVLDTLGGFADSTTDADKLEEVHRNKTGALIRASCRMGAISGLADLEPGDERDERLAAITTYGEAVGLMFQIVDDLIDVEQSESHVGKRVGKDADAGKLTFPVVHGADGSRKTIARLLETARTSVQPLGDAAAPLVDLATDMAGRTR